MKTKTYNSKLKLFLTITVILALTLGLSSCKNSKEEKFSIKDPIELKAENLEGTWTSGEKDKKTEITFKKYQVSIKSKALKNEKEFAKGSYSIDADSKDKMELNFPDRVDAPAIKVLAAVNKEELEIIVTDEKDSEAKALEGVYKKAEKEDDKKDAKKEEKKEDPKKPAITNEQAYATYNKVLNELGEDLSSYSYYDFSGDGVPELIANLGHSEAASRMRIYTIDQSNPDSARFLKEIPNGHSSLYTYNGNIYSVWGHMGFLSISELEYNNGDPMFTMIADGEIDVDDDSSIDSIYEQAGLKKSDLVPLEETSVE